MKTKAVKMQVMIKIGSRTRGHRPKGEPLKVISGVETRWSGSVD
jgi:hypothetical protein